MSLAKRWREWVYWPSRPEYAIPWLLGPLLFVVLGALGFSMRYLESSSGTLRPTGRSILFFSLGTCFNYVLLLLHTRSSFLVWRSALRPTLGTLCLLTLTYGLLWGGLLILDNALTCAICRGTRMNIRVTSHVASAAVQVLAAILFISAFWKAEDSNLAKLQRARDTALSVLGPVVRGQASSEQYMRLLEALKQIPAAGQEIGRLTQREHGLVTSWSDAAKHLYADLDGYTPEEIPLYIPPHVGENVAKLENERL
jgi:hypothetical protein